MDDRDAILARLRPSDGTPPAPGTVAQVRAVEGDLWAMFAERLEALGGRVVALSGKPTTDAIAAATGIDLTSAVGDVLSGDPWTAEVGVTWADLAVAETGTLVIRSGPGRARLHSLTPPIHIALIEENSIVGTLEQAMPAFAQDRSAVLITGPSRTADIEGVLVRGVHGPAELVVVRVRE